MNRNERWLRKLLEDKDYAAAIATKLHGVLDKSKGDDECWLFTGDPKLKGYGAIHLGTEKTAPKKWASAYGTVHRVAYVLHYQRFPEEGCVCHRCDTPICANPKHLFAGTPKDNTTDMYAKGRQMKHSDGWLPGENSPSAKHTAAQALGVIELTLQQVPTKLICQRLGVTKRFVRYVRMGEAWGSVTGLSPENPLQWKRWVRPSGTDLANYRNKKIA